MGIAGPSFPPLPPGWSPGQPPPASSGARRWSPLPLLLLLVPPLLLSGCPGEPCAGGCPTDHLCDPEAGRCLPRAKGCAELGCGERERCNLRTGRCEPQPDCLGQGCPPGQTCNTRTHLCEALGGCELEGCPPELICDPLAGVCLEPPCLRDEDCPAGTLCSRGGRCQEGCRPEHPCPPGWVCLLESQPGESGRCVAGCRQDADCAFGQACQVSGSPGQLGSCLREPPCAGRSDCRADERCERGHCVRGRCTEGIPCAAGELCDPDTGECRKALCNDDLFEDNDVAAQAAVLLPQSYSHLMICAGDRDWYRLRVGRRQQLRATLRFGSRAADLDLDLFDDDERLLATSRGTGALEEISFVPWWDGDLLVLVSGFKGSQSGYSLELALGPAPCPEDELSPNHRFQQAAAITPGRSTALRLCPGVDDWLRFDAAEGDGLQVRLRPLQEAGPGTRLSLTLFDAAGSTTEAAARGGEPEVLLEMPVLWQSGEQLLRLRGEALDGQGLACSVTLRLVAGGLSCADDQLEPNDSAAEAIPLEPRLYGGLLLCAGDPDWYQVSLPEEGAVLEVELSPASGLWGPENAPLLVLLRPADLGQLAEGQLEAGVLQLHFGPGVQSGSYLLGVLPPVEPSPPQPYLLQIGLSLPPPCADDRLEGALGNDSVELSAPFAPGLTTGLRLCPASPRDHYSFDVPPLTSLRARLRVEAPQGGGADRAPDLLLALLDENGVLLQEAVEERGGSGLVLLATAPDPGCCVLRVAAESLPFLGLGYRLELETGSW